MSRIDPENVIVLVRAPGNAIVRVGVSDWQELRQVLRPEHAGDTRRLKDIERQVSNALTDVASS